MKDHRFPDSQKIGLFKHRLKRHLSHEDIFEKLVRPNKISASWQKLWSGKGYLIGCASYKGHQGFIPTKANSTLLYICDDGKLRCSRTRPVFDELQTRCSGVGTLPLKIKNLEPLEFKYGTFVDDRDNLGQLNRFSLQKLLENMVINLK